MLYFAYNEKHDTKLELSACFAKKNHWLTQATIVQQGLAVTRLKDKLALNLHNMYNNML